MSLVSGLVILAVVLVVLYILSEGGKTEPIENKFYRTYPLEKAYLPPHMVLKSHVARCEGCGEEIDAAIFGPENTAAQQKGIQDFFRRHVPCYDTTKNLPTPNNLPAGKGVSDT